MTRLSIPFMIDTDGAIKQIAQFACGNVRTALKDADLQFAAEQS